MINIKLPVEGKFLLTGSRALGTRIAKDIDFICHSSQLLGDNWSFSDGMYAASKDNYDVILTDNHPSLENLIKLFGKKKAYRSPEVLFVLKASHIHIPRRNWFNDIQDYTILKNELYREYFHKQSGLIQNRLGRLIIDFKNELDNLNNTHQMKLNVTKDEFFNDGVVKFIDHDILHEMFAHEDEPIYKKTQTDQAEVFCSKSLWDLLSYQQKIHMVLEETYVIAAERFVIPRMVSGYAEVNSLYESDHMHKGAIYFNGDPGNLHLQTILNALKKVCTSLSSGYFREFSINNYYEICNNIDMTYFRSVCSIIHNEGKIYDSL